MKIAKSRTLIWLGFILVTFGLLLVVIPIMLAPVLHPNPEKAPSVIQSVPLLQSARAVNQAQRIVRARLSAENLPGVSVAVGIGHDIVWAEGFGFADLKTRMPITPNHQFRIGTASTILTSAAVGLLLEAGRLNLDAEIQTNVPEFPQKQWPLALRKLMAHTSGINTDNGEGRPLFTKHCGRPVDALPHFAHSALLFEPGTQYRYTDYGWILASAAVESAANHPFLTYMKQQIFDPLGMRDTIPDPTTVEDDDDHPLFNFFRDRILDPRTTRENSSNPARKPMLDRVKLYYPRFSTDANLGLHLARPLDFSCYAGSSVFLSTPSDLVRFGLAINGGKLLKPATVQLLQTVQRLASGESTGHGLGWDLQSITLGGEPTRAIGHNGEVLGGMVATLVTFPEHKMAVAVFSNIAYAETFAFAVKIAEVFAEQAKSNASQ